MLWTVTSGQLPQALGDLGLSLNKCIYCSVSLYESSADLLQAKWLKLSRSFCHWNKNTTWFNFQKFDRTEELRWMSITILWFFKISPQATCPRSWMKVSMAATCFPHTAIFQTSQMWKPSQTAFSAHQSASIFNKSQTKYYVVLLKVQGAQNTYSYILLNAD